MRSGAAVVASEVLGLIEAMGGRIVGQVLEGQRRFALQVRLHPDDRMDVAAIRDLRVRDPRGRLVPLSQLADITVEEGAAQITHERLQRRIAVETNVRGRDIASFVAEAERKVTKLDSDRQQIVQEQARLRDNLARVPANSDLQRRYLATLDKQETDLEGIAKQRSEAEKGVEAARSALRTYVSQLG